MNKQKQCMYDIEWQVLKMQLLGRWSDMESITQSLSMLTKYLTAGDSSPEVYLTRTFQIFTFLDTVRTCYSNQGITGNPLDEIVLTWRVFFQKAYYAARLETRHMDALVVPTKEQIIEDTRLIGKALAKDILDSLRKRHRTALNEIPFGTLEKRQKIIEEKRPELLWAITAMEEALSTNNRKAIHNGR